MTTRPLPPPLVRADSSVELDASVKSSPPVGISHQEAKNRDRPVRPVHLLKTIGLALGLTGLFMVPQFLIHIPTGIIAPISAGITTGGMMKVRPVESLIIGITLFLVITLPAPLAYLWFGFANHLPFIAVFAFAFAFGTYYGTLIGLFSWIGARINQSKIGV